MAYERDPGEIRPEIRPESSLFSIFVWLPLTLAALVIAGIAVWYAAAYVAETPAIDTPAVMPDPSRIPPQQPVPQ